MNGHTHIHRPTGSSEGGRRPAELAPIEAIWSGGVETVLIFGIDRVRRSVTNLFTLITVAKDGGAAAVRRDQDKYGRASWC